MGKLRPSEGAGSPHNDPSVPVGEWGGWQRALGWGKLGQPLALLPGVRPRLAERLMEFHFLSLPSPC